MQFVRKAAIVVSSLVAVLSSLMAGYAFLARSLSVDRVLTARRSASGDAIPQPYREKLIAQPAWITPGIVRENIDRPDVNEMDFPITMHEIELFEERYRQTQSVRFTMGAAGLILSVVALGWLALGPR
jgi:hypothetical protein